jgi:hypothetical protein
MLVPSAQGAFGTREAVSGVPLAPTCAQIGAQIGASRDGGAVAGRSEAYRRSTRCRLNRFEGGFLLFEMGIAIWGNA